MNSNFLIKNKTSICLKIFANSYMLMLPFLVQQTNSNLKDECSEEHWGFCTLSLANHGATGKCLAVTHLENVCVSNQPEEKYISRIPITPRSNNIARKMICSYSLLTD